MGAAPKMVLVDAEELEELIRKVVRTEVRAPESDVMTREAVAKMLDVNERTVVNYVEKHGLPASKLPNGWRFFRAEVLAWMKARPVKKAKGE